MYTHIHVSIHTHVRIHTYIRTHTYTHVSVYVFIPGKEIPLGTSFWVLLCREALGCVGGRLFGIAAVQQKLTPDLPKIAPRLGETPILTIWGNPRPYAIVLHSYRGLGAVLAPSWLRPGPILAPSWDHLRAILGHLGPSWARLGPS